MRRIDEICNLLTHCVSRISSGPVSHVDGIAIGAEINECVHDLQVLKRTIQNSVESFETILDPPTERVKKDFRSPCHGTNPVSSQEIIS